MIEEYSIPAKRSVLTGADDVYDTHRMLVQDYGFRGEVKADRTRDGDLVYCLSVQKTVDVQTGMEIAATAYIGDTVTFTDSTVAVEKPTTKEDD